MKKFKRILSAILIAAMALSLMPTFASAAVGDTYTYHFNPKGIGQSDTSATGYATDGTFTYDYTTVTDSTENITFYPWKYLAKSGISKIQTYKLSNSYCLQVGGNTGKYWVLAISLKMPDSGTFKAVLNSNTYTYSGSIDAYLLPASVSVENYVIPSDVATTYAEYKLNTTAINLYTAKATYDNTFDLTTNQDIEVAVKGEERILILSANTLVDNAAKTDLLSQIYINSLTLTKTAEAEDDTTVKHTVTLNANNGTTDTKTQDIAENTATPLDENSFTKEGYEFNGWNTKEDGTGETYADKEEVTLTTDLTLYAQWKLAPITLTFNNTTASITTPKAFNAFSAAEGQNFSFVANKSSSSCGANSSVQAYGLLMSTLRAGGTGKNWLAADKTNDKYAGMLTISANDIPAGKYKLSAGVHNFTRGAGVYYYVNDEYVGFDNAYATTGEHNDTNVTTEETIGYITITDSDNDSSTANPVEISLCSAAVDYETNANLYVLRSITFTPVDEIPASGDLTYEVTGATAAGDGYTVENNTTLSLSAMLSGKHLNGYTLDGTKDNNNYIKVSSSDESIVSVTDTNAALDSEAIYASGYKPVYNLTAHKSNASATITVEAIVDGNSVEEKTFTVAVAASDTDSYVGTVSFGYGTNLPAGVDASVTAAVDGDKIDVVTTLEKGKEITLTAPEVDGYRFMGWTRGNGVANSTNKYAYIDIDDNTESYDDLAGTYTIWSNTYVTAVYDEILENPDTKIVKFYDQDGFFLATKTAGELKSGLPEDPKLLGHSFEGWQYIDANGETKGFTADTELTESVTRVVAKQNPSDVTIIYQDENGNVKETKTYGYGDTIDAQADSGVSDIKYWELLVGEGTYKPVRTSGSYLFYAWADSTLKAYTETVPDELKQPKVVLNTTIVDASYAIEYDCYSKNTYTIVESGILLGDNENISLLSYDKKYTSATGGKTHGQFAAPHENYNYVRGYIIYKTNSTGALSVVYTDTVATEK